jgi:sirohydrochlorin ferrochelatase
MHKLRNKIMKRLLAAYFFFIIALGWPAPAQQGRQGDTQAAESRPAHPATGVVILAHGGNADWNQSVRDIAARVEATYPVEVAFGMATRRTMQEGINKLAERGVKEIVAVPLFVSSHSPIITSTAYLLRQTQEKPEALTIFAKMDHGDGSSAASPGGARHGNAHHDGTAPVDTELPIRMTGALDHHPIVADILIDRANGISDNPVEEVAIVVAHGPTSEENNRKWLAEMKLLVERMKIKTKFHRIDYLTVRDDAPKEIRGAAAEQLRSLVGAAKSEGKRALIVPLLLSFGGIERGLRTRLEGLDYRMTSQGLLPDPRLVEWIEERVRASE